MLFLKQSTSVVVQFGPFVDKTDGVTLEVGLSAAMDDGTTGIRLSKNGAVLVDRNDSTAPAYDAMGLYRITLNATDTAALGTLRMIFEEAATTLPIWADFMIMPLNVWDSMFGGDALQVDVIQVSGSAEDLSTATALATAQVDLDTLTDDWVDGGRLDLILDAGMGESSINTTAGAVDTVTEVTTPIKLREAVKATFILGVRA